jgi:sugar phosphate isomerase/epimerase
MTWGYAHVWFKEFLTLDPEPQLARLKFVKQWGLQSTGLDTDALMKLNESELDAVYQYADEHRLVINPTYDGGLFVADGERVVPGNPDMISRKRDRALEFIAKHRRALNARIVCTVAGPVHRFMQKPSLDEQMESLERELSPLAEGLAGMALPLAIENHGDYYVSDVVALCTRMRNTGLFLDTGNTYLVGERPLPAFEAGAPFALGTHFKDQRVRPRPEARPLHFEVAPAVTGEGDVPLRDAYRILSRRAPNPDGLVMEIELIPPAGVSPEEAMRRSVEFIRSLEA